MNRPDCTRTFLVTAVCLLLVLPAAATAGAAGLADLQAAAVANRQVLERYRAQLEQARLDALIGESPFWPSLDMYYTGNQLNDDSAFEDRQNSRFSTVLSVNVFSGFRDRYALTAARHQETSRRYELETITDDIRLAVALRYLDVYRRRDQEQVAREQFKLLKKRYDDTNRRYQVGLIQKNDLLKIEVELDNTNQRLRESQATHRKSVNQLAFATGTDVKAGEQKFEEFEQLPEVLGFDAYQPRMLANRSEIKALEMVILARENDALASRADYWPRVDLAAGYTRFGDNFTLGDRTQDKDEGRVTLEMAVNLFEGYATRHGVSRARLDVRKARAELEELRNRLSTELRNILLDFEVGRRNIQVADAGLRQAEENLRVTDIAYAQGVRTATELLDAIFFLSRARLNRVVARIDLFLNHYRLKRMLGEI